MSRQMPPPGADMPRHWTLRVSRLPGRPGAMAVWTPSDDASPIPGDGPTLRFRAPQDRALPEAECQIVPPPWAPRPSRGSGDRPGVR